MEKERSMDALLWAGIVLCLAGGLLVVYSSSAFLALKNHGNQFHYVGTQSLYAAIGLVFMGLLSKVDYHFWETWAPHLLGVSIVALILVYTPLGATMNGGTRWIKIFGLKVQPSEFAKFSLILFLAYSLSRWALEDQFALKRFTSGFLRFLLVPIIVMGLIAPEPDVGTAALLGCVVMVMMFVAGTKVSYIISLFFIGLLGLGMAAWQFDHVARRLRDYLGSLSFMFGNQDLTVLDYQLRESVMAIGSGGLTGMGLGQGTIKIFFLPQMHSDFIFSSLSQELGFIGSMTLIAMYLFIVYRGWRIALKAPDLFGMYAAYGISALFGIQALMNMCVVMGLLPQKGIVLPLYSHGGSSLVAMLMAFGILLNISRHSVADPKGGAR